MLLTAASDDGRALGSLCSGADRERVGVAILRKMANIIINAIKGVPHPALLEARRH